jgi:ATP:ADP antiporter, AAA family
MKERLYRTLNIKHSESSQVFDLLTVQFFIGLANALVNVIALSLFVYNLSIHSLPLVYLVIAGFLILFNFIYEKLEHRFSPLQLLKYIIGFAGVLLIVLWCGLTYGNKSDFIFILLVASVLIYMITGYAFWGLVSLLFNVRESRRVFSIVGSGDIPAKMIGYIAGPLLIPLLGMTNLIWFAVFSLCTGLILFHRFTKKKNWDVLKKKSQHIHHDEEVNTKQGFVSFFFKNKLIFAISLLSIISYNVFVLVDYTFISQVKLRFENITDLAAYIAIFFAFGRLIALAFKLIFTSRVIERLGVIYCLFITPAALFLFCLVFFINGDQSTYNLFIFGLMAMLTEVLRSTMQEPVFFILFQPLKENLRLKGHIISKGYMYPPSLIIVGLSLLFLHRSGVEVTILLAIKVVIINLCIWGGIIFFMRRTYLNTIHASIRKGIFNSDEIYITDQKAIDILLQKIDTGKKIEVIYGLNILEKSGYPAFNDLLEQQLAEGKDVEIKKYALDRLEAAGKVNTAMLNKLLPGTKDPELEQKVVFLLCKYDEAFLKNASEDIPGHNAAVRKIIIINLLNQREFTYLFKAGNEINRLLYSSNESDRELAVDIISELKTVQFSDAIERLINDESIAVQRVAITAACKLRMKALLPSVFKLLDEQAHKNIVLKGLQTYGDFLFEDIQVLPGEMQVNNFLILLKLPEK